MATDNRAGAGLSSRRIRIVHLQLLPLMSGVQRVSLDELTRLDRNRFEPFVICKETGPFTEALVRAGIPFFLVPELVREISPRQDWLALHKLTRLFREQRFDIVHTHSSKTGILGRLAGRLAGVPVVMHTVHGYAFPAARNAFQFWLYLLLEWLGARITDALILLKREDAELAAKRLQVAADRLHLVPNGVDVLHYVPRGEAERNLIRQGHLGVTADCVAIGMVGRLWHQKNPDCFVRAAIRLLRSGHDQARFFLIGDGELRPSLEARLQEVGCADRIRILGWQDDVAGLLAGLDIFVLPSRWEGLSLAILEAMSSGLPVVVSDIPGNRDLVNVGVDGYVFRPDDDADLAAKLASLIADADLRRRFGTNGRRKVTDRFTLADRIDKIERIYLQLLERKAALG
ncbi:glycosyltransferase involved in cell wall biosynthesis [Sulfuritortus calidifontis]|uniref:Glycosyltransferase involved in cell wall biosynthesis n=1 Tax=Sulfuritortus calidifontis TaxID=1914471 RepID=A0A4V2UQP3_9PROT|nr:glycosyltransferase family 4 protein [Sulfuritortus calidifontis]TCS71932.1 glycosyltransferase involved in cell wall biosynthesis [Sulfuritortus calidifontis]